MNKQVKEQVNSIGKVISIDFESLMAWRLNYGYETFELAKNFDFEGWRNKFLIPILIITILQVQIYQS